MSRGKKNVNGPPLEGGRLTNRALKEEKNFSLKKETIWAGQCTEKKRNVSLGRGSGGTTAANEGGAEPGGGILPKKKKKKKSPRIEQKPPSSRETKARDMNL